MVESYPFVSKSLREYSQQQNGNCHHHKDEHGHHDHHGKHHCSMAAFQQQGTGLTRMIFYSSLLFHYQKGKHFYQVGWKPKNLMLFFSFYSTNKANMKTTNCEPCNLKYIHKILNDPIISGFTE